MSKIFSTGHPSVKYSFCRFFERKPLNMQRDKELKNDDPNNRTGIRDLMLDFRHHLEHMGLAPKTINSYDGANPLNPPRYIQTGSVNIVGMPH